MGSETKLRALVVENNPTAANLLRLNLIRRDFEVECLPTLQQAIVRAAHTRAKEQPRLDVILLDLSLPDSEGITTFHELYRYASDIPIVVMSSLTDQNLAQEAISSGAQDFLVKGIPSAESVARCLRYAAERQRFEVKLWESERLTRLIIENAHDAFASIDAGGIITGWNIQAENIFGFFRKDAIGKSFVDTIIPADLREFFNQQIEAFLAGTRGNLINNRVEMALLRNGGQLFPAEIAIFPVTIGSSYTFCTFVHDISERKSIEKRLRAANKALEDLLNDRRSQNDDGQGSLNLSSSALRDIKEPLEALQGYTASLQNHCRQVGDESAVRFAQTIARCASQIHLALTSSSTQSNASKLSRLFPPSQFNSTSIAGPNTIPLPKDTISK
ncbi:MAG: PAS domain S-box protein [Candidatus Obscuribacterales bacterium]|nr:PAS domain S-box protein [Candidatus Obscuribacterales bacterium]